MFFLMPKGDSWARNLRCLLLLHVIYLLFFQLCFCHFSLPKLTLLQFKIFDTLSYLTDGIVQRPKYAACARVARGESSLKTYIIDGKIWSRNFWTPDRQQCKPKVNCSLESSFLEVHQLLVNWTPDCVALQYPVFATDAEHFLDPDKRYWWRDGRNGDTRQPRRNGINFRVFIRIRREIGNVQIIIYTIYIQSLTSSYASQRIVLRQQKRK